MVFLLFAFLVAFFYQNFRRRQIINSGVYSIGRIMSIEGGKGGTLIKFAYHIRGDITIALIKNDFYKVKINEQYFIKILPSQTDQVIFLYDKQVPDCLLNVVPPKEGWKELPKCEE
ncbi:MAG: hypothetical protein RLZZ316_2582 [Bacteroidota bacterium]